MSTNVSLGPIFALSVLLSLPLAHAQVFPSGFTVDVLASGLTGYTVAIGVAPDGRVFICALNGRMEVWAGGPRAFVGHVPNVSLNGNGGLQDIAVDPGWPARPYIYCYWNLTTSPTKRISRFTITGDLSNPNSNVLSLGAQYIIIDGIPDQTSIHNGGTLRFGPDGLLYCSIGEDFMSECNAQDDTTFLGKVIRFNVASLPPTGTGPPPLSQIAPSSGPFSNAAPESHLIWARGLRNPWRMTVDPLTGDLFVGDVGSTFFEEINQIVTGGENFGWPLFEGPMPLGSCPASNLPFTAPIVAFDRNTIPNESGIIAPVALYRNIPNAPYNFGPEYEGNLFYSMITQVFWRRMIKSGNTWVVAPQVPGQIDPQNWADQILNLHDAELGHDGSIYFLQNWPPNALYRVRGTSTVLTITAGDQQPINALTSCLTPLTVRLTRAGGQPLAGVPVTFALTSGSGTLGPQPVLTDANGFASTTVQAGTQPIPSLTIEAGSPGSNTVNFTLPWRGLTVHWQPAVRTLTLDVRHSATLSPVTLALDAPGMVSIPTPIGTLETSLFAPSRSFFALDGLGLLGPPLPGIATGTPNPVLSLTVNSVPVLGGLPLVFQAYAFDPAFAPSLSAILISNPVKIVIN